MQGLYSPFCHHGECGPASHHLITRCQTHYYSQRQTPTLSRSLTPSSLSSTFVLLCPVSIGLTPHPIHKPSHQPGTEGISQAPVLWSSLVPDQDLLCCVLSGPCSFLCLGSVGEAEPYCVHSQSLNPFLNPFVVLIRVTGRFCSCLTRRTSNQGHVHARAFNGSRTCVEDNCFEP